jgi:hypothetical protein
MLNRKVSRGNWRFEINEGVGHEFANKYIPRLRDWGAGVRRSAKKTK